MKRRDFVRLVTIGSAGAVMPKCLAATDRFPDGKPNILFLFADDQCYETLRSLGSEVQTPNLDRLAANGVTFTHAYNQGAWGGAVCIASRTMLVTGRFLWHAKAIENTLEEEAQARRLWPQILTDAGYDTYMSGKWHVKVDAENIFRTTKHIRPGMPDQTDEGYDRPKSEADYSAGWKPWETERGGYWQGGKHWSEVLADDGIEFIRQTENGDKPFFIYLAFNAPHDPRQSPKEYVDRYPLDQVTVPENFLPEYPYKDAMGCDKELRDERLAPFPRTSYSVRVNRQEYYAIITHMDAQIGRILNALDQSGKADNTYIFFTADNGLAVGHHGLLGKQSLFEHSVRIPLIVTGPGVPRGKQMASPVYLQDIMPSTLNLAGIEIPEHLQFKSLMPLIAGTRTDSYNAIYGGYMELQRMVHKNNYKLICYPKIQKTLLFDPEKDPQEMHDLAADPQYASVVEDLKRTLQCLQRQTGDTLVLGEFKDEACSEDQE
ncbi:MAG TPA: sulfatase-like hydrolase/transferase [bacterium]|nr:sulfatase-like hydrolase/transferase [bacterium]